MTTRRVGIALLIAAGVLVLLGLGLAFTIFGEIVLLLALGSGAAGVLLTTRGSRRQPSVGGQR